MSWNDQGLYGSAALSPAGSLTDVVAHIGVKDIKIRWDIQLGIAGQAVVARTCNDCFDGDSVVHCGLGFRGAYLHIYLANNAGKMCGTGTGQGLYLQSDGFAAHLFSNGAVAVKKIVKTTGRAPGLA